MRKPPKERCDYCGKWVPAMQLLLPPVGDQSGKVAICEKCAEKYKDKDKGER